MSVKVASTARLVATDVAEFHSTGSLLFVFLFGVQSRGSINR